MTLPIGAITSQVPGVGGLSGLDTGARQVPVIGRPGGPTFGETLTRAINEVSDAQDASAELAGKFMRGENVELHQVMAASEEAGISLEMLVEVRNKVTEAYRTLINIQS